jgi:hypothetical protein
MLDDQNFTMYSGDTIDIEFDVTFQDPADSLVGSSIKWILAKDGQVLIEKNTGDGITIIDETIFRVSLGSNDTKSLFGEGFRHEVEVAKNGEISTVAVGKVEIKYTYIKRMV